MYALRPYQEAARQAVLTEFDKGCSKTLLILPTGTGKTIVFASIVQEQVSKGHRVLILAHREELLQQASDKLMSSCGLCTALEKAGSSSLGSFIPVTVGSIQTLTRDSRLHRFPRDYFQDIVVDEAHHCLSESYKKVLEYFDGANVLGVTATPDRGDKKSLGEYFDGIAYEYSMMDAIREGYLSPVRAQMIPLELDMSKVKVTAGDYAVNDIGCALEPYLEQIALEMVKYAKGRKTVVFLPLIATSQKFCAMLNEVGLRAVEVNGTSADRAEILRDFEGGKYDVLCNSMLLTEGWDCPSVDCIVVLRPTKVRSLYQQMIGRGMRLAEGKEHLLVLDFLWMTSRHDLCKPSALMGGDEEEEAKIDQLIAEGLESLDLIEVKEKAKRDVIKEREEALRKTIEEQRRKKAKLVDPIQYAYSIADYDLTDYEPVFDWEMQLPTEAQIRQLENSGISTDAIKSRGLASLLIDRLIKRRSAGLATPKQIRCLERSGFREVGTWRFEDASKMIARLAARGWQTPMGVVPATYKPTESR